MRRRPTICDFSPFYCDKGGGIRTFHRARIDWFRRQSRYRYVLISPGPGFLVSELSSTVTIVQVYGSRLTGDADGYRFVLDYRTVRSVLAEIQPDVLEANDPWFSGPFSLWQRERGVFQGLVTSFCHSDPVATYVRPRMRGWWRASGPARWLVSQGERGLTRLQRCYDATLVASHAMCQRLQRAGVARARSVGFGVDPELLAMKRARRGVRSTRLLYAGRLDDDKEIRLLLDVLPDLMRRSDVSITIVGSGKYRAAIEAFRHPRALYGGFVAGRAAMRRIYGTHDILLAPGRFETFGLAALEAAAAGLAVVGPDQGGTGELLQQMQSPLIFPAGDQRKFFETIQLALDGDVAPVVERGRAVAQTYGTWDDAVARHVAVYEHMLEGSRAAQTLGRSA